MVAQRRTNFSVHPKLLIVEFKIPNSEMPENHYNDAAHNPILIENYN